MNYEVDWLTRWDIPKVLEIEYLCFEFPWDEAQLRDTLKRRPVIARVIKRNKVLLGYVIYAIYEDKLELLNMAVLPSMQRKQCGAFLLGNLLHRIERRRRKRVTALVRESNLEAQLFLKKMGFKAVEIKYNAYEETDDAGYLMECYVGQNVIKPKHNRIFQENLNERVD